MSLSIYTSDDGLIQQMVEKGVPLNKKEFHPPPGSVVLSDSTGWELLATVADKAPHFAAIAYCFRAWIDRNKNRKLLIELGDKTVECTALSEAEMKGLIEEAKSILTVEPKADGE